MTFFVQSSPTLRYVSWLPSDVTRPIIFKYYRNFFILSASIDAQLDYRNDTCLPVVKNQAPVIMHFADSNYLILLHFLNQCGSCWAFASIAPIEFAHCKKYKTATVLR